MDWSDYTSRGVLIIKKYRYIILLVISGIILICIPTAPGPTSNISPTEAAVTVSPSLEESLSNILSMIENAGRVEVLLTSAFGEEILYQTDETRSTGESGQDIRRETVLVSGTERSETGLIKQKNPPVYQGAVVLCQGADRADVRLSIVEAVMDVTGLTSDKITVLKMK